MKDYETAILLFKFIADHDFDESIAIDEFFSSDMNSTVLDGLKALCDHFNIDTAKMEAFLKTQIPCDYCGEATGDIQYIDEENVCKKCLEEV